MTDMTASFTRPARHSSASDIVARVSHWLNVARSRRALAALDAMQLADLGISATEAHDEASRPFWDAPSHWCR
ncbi:MAG: DUF1127 domain-containing protein [Rhodobacteraceae bacterium]|nr:DUF1127 domain-containing protein [Paracoccaceae bacterium]